MFLRTDVSGPGRARFAPPGPESCAPRPGRTVPGPQLSPGRCPSHCNRGNTGCEATTNGRLARLERDLLGGSGFGDVFGPEKVTACEAGYRRLLNDRFWYDVAAFYNVYDDLRTTETSPSPQLRNLMHGRTYGGEVAARWEPVPRLRLDAAYSYLQIDLELDPTSTAAGQAGAIEGSSPSQQLVLRAQYDPVLHWEIDAALRFVDRLPALGIPGYTALDAGVVWHPDPDLELAMAGQNLLASHHPEQIFEGTNGVATEVQRGVYARLTYGF